LAQYLDKAGVNAAAIHGNKSQAARTRALSCFKQGKVRVLGATDIAARGLDIAALPQVVNFDLPNVPEDYVHRIGRTARAGASGKAYSLVSADEFPQLKDIEQLIQQHIAREYAPGFEPQHEVPASAPLRKPNTGSRGHQRSRGPRNNTGGNNNGGNNTARKRGSGGQRRAPRRASSHNGNS